MSVRTKKGEPVVIKKYANRRLYDTGRSSYVTLEDLCIMVKEGCDFVVYDAKTGEDLTRSVLTQIIVEQESSGQGNLLPTNFLRQLIGFYGDNMQQVIPNYLEQSFDAFVKNQEAVRDQFSKSFGGIFPSGSTTALEEMTRKNMVLFEKTMSNMFGSFGAMQNTAGKTAAAPSREAQADARVRDLKNAMSEMQKEIDRLSGK